MTLLQLHKNVHLDETEIIIIFLYIASRFLVHVEAVPDIAGKHLVHYYVPRSIFA